jgi:YebC/PmpR family DNA-binding regulatory protein
MSGHSKWAKIKHQKGVTDAKRGAMFTKLAKNITLAASEGGADSDTNFALRLAVNKAKAVNMPSDNIERAIKKAVGGDAKTSMQRVSYEGMIGNIGFIVDCQTDNINRTVAEVKRIIENHGAKMVNPGSVSWNFVEKGLINVKPEKIVKSTKFGVDDSYSPVKKEDAELDIMEIEGIEDIKEAEGQDESGNNYPYFEIFTDKSKLREIHTKVEQLGYHIDSLELMKLSKDLISVNEHEQEKIDNIIEALEENDDVDEIWTNIE